MLCFGGSIASELLSFARVVPDDAIFAYLGDVFLLPEHQRRGYSKVLMDAVMALQRAGAAPSCHQRCARAVSA
nr:GNAT family N-acetyltransferase [Xanthomonas vasicola]